MFKIDNFSKILPLLEFEEDTYYFVQIIKRRKDEGNEMMKDSEKCLWQKFIEKPESLLLLKQEIQELCTIYNARAYIDINPRSLENWSYELIKKLLDRIKTSNFKSVHRIPNRIALSEDTIKTKNLFRRRWLLDVDKKTDIPIVENWVSQNNIKEVINIPTLSGAHIIVESFNFTQLGLKLGGEVKIGDTMFIISANANTLLYY